MTNAQQTKLVNFTTKHYYKSSIAYAKSHALREELESVTFERVSFCESYNRNKVELTVTTKTQKYRVRLLLADNGQPLKKKVRVQNFNSVNLLNR
jgi:hypothetical protein|tara:strand:+ start:604 stop:888 length:285 start_codon:yes stop_codon:yes gene_type:complete